ncbi:LacI family DNA-binding transcriptional regulator [Microbacterium immunditiarum]|uniref:LacI family transcriptional regulator n=1 Tax=Microbacterium immunditiarum TaxID=337480 RepID=A0A7Y9GND3_9MICO|nr:substrate-binding domain-containing protein [Microbacterium immunditiarum]NYE19695.1 LacI family transcriptional regulator [Microbacterium immunditiarum]
MSGSPLAGLFAPAGAADEISLTAHHGEFVAALEREVRGRGHRLVLLGVASPADIAAQAEGLAGVVLLGFRDDELAGLPDLGTRAVAIDAYARHPSLAVIRTDDAEGGRRAAEVLLSRGHRDVLVVGPSDETSGVMRERHEGFRSVFVAAGAGAPARHMTAGTTVREGVMLGRALRARHPSITAVFAAADTLAVGVMEGLALAGARVPADVSVLGFDDLALASVVTPKLSTVAQDIPRKARLAAEALLDPRLAPSVAGPLTVDVVVIERASIGRAAR